MPSLLIMGNLNIKYTDICLKITANKEKNSDLINLEKINWKQ